MISENPVHRSSRNVVLNSPQLCLSVCTKSSLAPVLWGQKMLLKVGDPWYPVASNCHEHMLLSYVLGSTYV